MRITARRLAAILAMSLLVGLMPLSLAHADAVTGMDDPVYQRSQTTGLTLVTPWSDEAALAGRQWGYTIDLGPSFRASTTPEPGLTPVHRLWHPTRIDFTTALAGSTAFTAARSAGYQDQGARFYALASPITGRTEVVNSYVKNGKHRLATAAEGVGLVASGWTSEGSAFHVPTTSSATPRATVSPTSSATPRTTVSPTSSATPPTTVSPTSTAGSAPVGSARYPIPAGALFVAPTGNDNSGGTQAAPFKTIGRALAVAPAGGTIIVRGGSYRESLTWSKKLTVQNFPGETVWLEGSDPVAGWVKDGSSWRKDGWTTRFDHSPTYTQGAPDLTTKDWQFVNTSTHPMAAHPDQVFIDGKPLQQVKSRSLVTTGTFYFDEAASKLYLGSDPAGRTVEASTKFKAMSIRGASSTVRGIGIRRFAPSVFHMGSITIEAPSVRFENVAIEDAATTGISILATDTVLDRVTVRGSGMLGIHARFADRLTFSNVLSTGNNDERFNVAPVSGGAKIGQTRGVTIRESSFSGNFGHGFWEDMSVYDTIVRQSKFNDNVATGLFLEISAKAVVGDNEFVGNDEDGIRVNNTSDVQIWNNKFVGNGRPVNLVQDGRRNTNRNDPAVDFRVPFPDPAMPWTLGRVTVRNNVIAAPTAAANCLLCVEDYSYQKTAEQMGISADGNVYHRATASSPTWIAIWSRGAANRNPHVFTTLDALRQTTGQERNGREYVGAPILNSERRLVTSVSSLAPSIAQPLPTDVAAKIGRPAGSRVLGSW